MDRCPYCLSWIETNEDAEACAACGTVHHAECIRENDGCAVKDCANQPRPDRIEIAIDEEPRTLLVLSKESVEQSRSRPMRVSNPCMRCGRQLPEGRLYCSGCMPPIGEDQDARNIGPLLVMIAVIGLAVLFAVLAFGPDTVSGLP
jgi:hypothetical protein